MDSAAAFAGGLGLFLLGMVMLTDGLKLAAGSLLQDILRRFTRTPPRALASGVLVTALVQSSTAVTVALIGFINAGLLTFGQALWVIFGANLGTSMTGWLVAIIGFKLKIEAFALPVIAIGMILYLTGGRSRRAGAGTALTGFGVLFLGLDLLQSAFAGVADTVDLPSGTGPVTMLILLLIGFGLTVLMQSSSAALAVTLTAAQTGVISIHGAAVITIGVNVGTTVTAVLAALAATSNAKRAAGAHILFNLITGAAALLLLPVLLPALLAFQEGVLGDDSPAVTLALFHTSFNLLGVLLMVPLARHMARWLESRFMARDERFRTRYVDDTVAGIPELAVQAMRKETRRLGTTAVDGALHALGNELDLERARLVREDVLGLSAAVNEFVVRVNREDVAEDTSRELADVLRAKRSYETIALLVEPLAQWPTVLGRDDPYISAAADAIRASHPFTASAEPPSAAHADACYRELRASLLAAGAGGSVGVADMDAALNVISVIRRIVKKAVEARELLEEEPRELGPEGRDPSDHSMEP
ncbi:Na/Pi cotransporter family protein [Lolliginicoccus suaedae]|uniref:Na/Pi cotransporter family protein n=1 Tax=Lolliginicoccus suaedae TaxID=2605429 RepID=UPI0011EC37FF|nr:Na/Pi symporter [Lolliginicoccus suaedae]